MSIEYKVVSKFNNKQMRNKKSRRKSAGFVYYFDVIANLRYEDEKSLYQKQISPSASSPKGICRRHHFAGFAGNDSKNYLFHHFHLVDEMVSAGIFINDPEYKTDIDVDTTL